MYGLIFPFIEYVKGWSVMKKILMCLVALAISGVAFAEPAKESGAYLGAGFAGTTFDDGGAFAGLDFDDSDSGLAIFGGYKFLKHLAVEARYNDFGAFTLEGFGVEVSSLSVHACLYSAGLMTAVKNSKIKRAKSLRYTTIILSAVPK